MGSCINCFWGGLGRQRSARGAKEKIYFLLILTFIPILHLQNICTAKTKFAFFLSQSLTQKLKQLAVIPWTEHWLKAESFKAKQKDPGYFPDGEIIWIYEFELFHKMVQNAFVICLKVLWISELLTHTLGHIIHPGHKKLQNKQQRS